MEIWKDIEGYEGCYQVSNKGRVRSLDRHIKSRYGYTRLIKGKIINQHISGLPYFTVWLSKKGRYKAIAVHRLIATAFIPNPDNLPWVNHKDENKENNSIDNLEWCTAEYNANYGSRNKKLSEKLTNRHDLSKPVHKCDMDGNILKTYPSLAEAAREVGAAYVGIRVAANGGYLHKSTNKWMNAVSIKGYRWKWAN